MNNPKKTVQVGPYTFADPYLKGRRMDNGKFWTTGILFQYNVEQVLAMHNKFHAKRNKKVSFSTMSHRRHEIKAMCWMLLKGNYRLILPTNIKCKHVIFLTRSWELDETLQVSTVLQKISILRTFLSWMGKSDVIDLLSSEEMFKEPEKMKRSLVVKEDKGWNGKVDILKAIQNIEIKDAHVARQLMLCYLFGLRAKEAMMFKPHLDFDREQKLINVHRGAKGGRPRQVVVDTEAQLELLNDILLHCHYKRDSMIPRMIPLKRWVKHYYYICNKCGLSRKNGLTSHGLRHSYAHRLYQEHTGVECAARNENKKPDVPVVMDRIARMIIAENLGHNRQSISSAYVG